MHTALAARYLDTEAQPQHVRLQALCADLNVANQKDTRMKATTRATINLIVMRLAAEAQTAQDEAMARVKMRRVGLWCRVRNWWGAV